VESQPLALRPAVITYFRQGRLDKYFRSHAAVQNAEELDFSTTAETLSYGNVGNFWLMFPRKSQQSDKSRHVRMLVFSRKEHAFFSTLEISLNTQTLNAS